MASFDHLVGAQQQLLRKGEAERPGGFSIDYQFEFCRLLEWQLPRFSAFQDLVHEYRRAPVIVPKVRSVTHETAELCVFARQVDRYQLMFDRTLAELAVLLREKGVSEDDERLDALERHRLEAGFDLLRRAGAHPEDADRVAARGRLYVLEQGGMRCVPRMPQRSDARELRHGHLQELDVLGTDVEGHA